MAKNSKAAKQEYRDAIRALDELGMRERRAGVREETPEYWKANGRVADAEKNVSRCERIRRGLTR